MYLKASIDIDSLGIVKIAKIENKNTTNEMSNSSNPSNLNENE
jgi:hypothetical protein